MSETKDCREEIINNLCMYVGSISKEPIANIKQNIYVLLHDVEIISRSTEVAILDTDKDEYILKKYIIAKTVSGLSEKTLKFYKDTIIFFQRYINKSFNDLTPDDIRYYFAVRQMKDKVSKTTCDNERRNLNAFFKWVTDEGLIDKNPMRGIGPIKTAKMKKEALTEIEIEKLREAAYDEREKLIIEFLLSTGCRVTETSQVLLDEIDGEKVLVHGKGGKDRYVYLNAKAQFALEKYLAVRKDSNPYLFPGAKNISSGFLKSSANKKGNRQKELRSWWRLHPDLISADTHIDSGVIEMICRKMAKRAGVEQANPHKFRRTCATWALRRGMPVEQVSKMLGHSSIETTQIYLDLSEDDLKEAHRKYVV